MMTHVVLPIMIAGSLPFLLTLATKVRVFGARENHQTRVWQAQLTGWRQRAYWAHQNAFETFPLFVAAAILAFLAAPASGLVIGLTWAYPAVRVAYSLCYIYDLASLRSLVWFGSMAVIVALFVTALSH